MKRLKGGTALLCLFVAFVGCQERLIEVNFRAQSLQPVDGWLLIKQKAAGDVTLAPIVQRLQEVSLLLTIESTAIPYSIQARWNKALAAISTKNDKELPTALQILLSISEKIIASRSDLSIRQESITTELTALATQDSVGLNVLRKELNRPPAITFEESALFPSVGVSFSVGNVIVTDPDFDALISSYQWQSSSDGGKTFADLKGATSKQFQPTLTQAHAQIRYVVKVDDGWSGVASLTSKSFLVQNTAPKLLDAVPILGIMEPGATVSIDLVGHTVDTDGDVVSAAYQWQFSDDGVSFVDIPNETSKDLIVNTSFKHEYLRCKITLSDSYQGSTTTYSQVQQMANLAPAAFASTTSLVDTASVGKDLGCSGSTTDPNGDSLQYSIVWESSADAGVSYQKIVGASAVTYTLTFNEAHKMVRCHMVASDLFGGITTSSSGAAISILNSAPSGLNVTIDPSKKVGESFTCADSATDLDHDTLSKTYDWQSSADNVTFASILGATSSTFTLTIPYAHKYIRCHLSVNDGNGGTTDSISASSRVTNSVPVLGTVILDGPKRIGEVLTCSGTASDADGDTSSYLYYWQVSNDNVAYAYIANAASSSYLLNDNEARKYVRCQMLAVDGFDGSTETPIYSAGSLTNYGAVAFTSPAADSVSQLGTTITGSCETGVVINLSGSGLSSPNTTTCTARTFSQAILFTAGDGAKTITLAQTYGDGSSTTATRSFVRYDGWMQQAYIKAASVDSSDNFGNSVSLSGDSLAVGVPFEDSNQTTITNGTSASADNSKSDSGAVYVYRRSGISWAQEAYLKAVNADSGDRLGWSVSLSGDSLAVGATSEASNQTTITNGTTASANNSLGNSGAVYLYRRSGINWAQEAYLKAVNAGVGDGFGRSVSLSGDSLAVGADCEASTRLPRNYDAAIGDRAMLRLKTA